jgi:hypothetical protein
MDEGDRKNLQISLKKGDSFLLAVENKAKDHTKILSWQIPDGELGIELTLTQILARVVQIHDDTLYHEHEARKRKKKMSSV